MAGVSSFQICGTIGRIDERRGVVSVSVAVNGRDRDGNEKTDWFRVAVFGKSSDFVLAHCGPGDLVFASGRMRVEKWEKQGVQMETIGLACWDFQLLRKKAGAGNSNETEKREYQEAWNAAGRPQNGAMAQNSSDPMGSPMATDDIPF